MKAWMETRWRLLAILTYLLISLCISYSNNAGRGVLTALWFLLTVSAMPLAGSGVKSQAPIGFSEGLAGSTQFTLSLPVTRVRLLAVRAAVGLAETWAVTVMIACLAWTLFPWLRASTTPGDFARVVSTTLLFLFVPYCAHLFFTTWMDEPLSMFCAGFTLMLLLWLCHRIAPAVDVVRAFGQASPLLTHTLPWPQMATCAGLASILSLAAARVVQAREY